MESTKRNIREAIVAVVGGSGFLGSHLVNHLIDDRNCKVIVIDNLITGQKKWIHPKATFFHHDITGSEEQLLKLFKKEGVEYVFNYAAEPYIPVSFERPMHVFNINAMGALKVMNAAHEAGAKGILQVSSAEIYGKVDGKIKETDQAVPHSTYGAAKLAIDSLVQCRWKEAQVPAIAMRQFNCVGERESHPYVIPEIIQQIHKNKPATNGHTLADRGKTVVSLGNDSFRDFQYAGDAVKMAVELLEKGEFGEVYNMGSETGVNMYELAIMIGKIMGKDVIVEQDPAKVRPWEIWHLQSDNTKLYSIIEGRPEVTLEQALIKTVNYFHENGDTFDF